MSQSVRAIWRLAPESWRRQFWRMRPDFHLARSTSLGGEGPLVIAGLMRAPIGIGASARALWGALDRVGLSPLAVDLTDSFGLDPIECDAPLSAMSRSRQGDLVLVFNAPEVVAALTRLGLYRGRSWRMIAYWAWELPTFPQGWERALKFFDEIWVGSPFVADAIGQHPNAPKVHVVPVPIVPPPQLGVTMRTHRDERFVVLTMADALSSMQRKNQVGAIAAFRAAFGERPDCQLIVKTQNLEKHPAAHEALVNAMGGADNITLMDARLSEHDRWALMAKADAIVSLHRSEGFGMVPAEAMAIGKPVVATAYSGVKSFMNSDVAYLVDYTLAPVTDPFGIYADAEAVWAEPDVQHAAAHLAAIREQPEASTAIGERARVHIAKLLSFEAVGENMKARLRRNTEFT